jgi:hypothetical protein
LRFNDLAGDVRKLTIVLVKYRDDPSHLKAMRKYWRDRGIDTFTTFELINRGGALFVEHMQYETYAEVSEARALLRDAGVEPVCAAPFLYLFIGYDGQYYLDSSDWKKQVPLGSVFDVSFTDIMATKLAHVRGREAVCKSCTLDPINIITDALRRNAASSDSQEIRDAIEKIRQRSAFSLALF